MTPEVLTSLLTLVEGLPAGWKIFFIVFALVGAGSSVAASLLNASVRDQTAAGIKQSQLKLAIVSGLNFISGNFDKFWQLAKMLKGLPVTTTGTVPGAIQLPAEPQTLPAEPTKPPEV